MNDLGKFFVTGVFNILACYFLYQFKALFGVVFWGGVLTGFINWLIWMD